MPKVCICAKGQYDYVTIKWGLCYKNSTYPFDLEIKLQFYLLFVAKTIYALYLLQKNTYKLFCRKNDLPTSSGKFLRVEFSHPESSDFLGICNVPPTGYAQMGWRNRVKEEKYLFVKEKKKGGCSRLPEGTAVHSRWPIHSSS